MRYRAALFCACLLLAPATALAQQGSMDFGGPSGSSQPPAQPSQPGSSGSNSGPNSGSGAGGSMDFGGQGSGPGAGAGGGAGATTGGATSGEGSTTVDLSGLEATPSSQATARTAAPPSPTKIDYSDIQVIERKAFLKSGRFELAPAFGLSVNDPLIRHYTFGGEASYFLSDAFSVGVEANLFLHEFQDAYYLVPLDDRVLPSVNQTNFEGAVDFGYIPVYGKFAFLETGIIHWEGWLSGGVGLTQTEVVPRDPSEQGWTNNNITPNVGVGIRVFLNRWITFKIGLRDYMMLDKFEPQNRTRTESLAQVEAGATQSFVQNLVLDFGVGLWMPPFFEYTTNR